jgi:hypothetical protein
MKELIVPDFLPELIDAGIGIGISKDPKLGFYFDLNLQAKSHMYLYLDFDTDTWRVAMRYDKDYAVDREDPISDLKSYAREGMCGRDYINDAWAEFLMSDKQRAERKLAKEAMAKLSPEEIQAILKSKLFAGV